MKQLYKSPVITVEELTKEDILCASDNGKFSFSSIFKNITGKENEYVWTDIPE